MGAPIGELASEAFFAVAKLRTALQADGFDGGAFPLVPLFEAECVARDIAAGRRDFDRADTNLSSPP